VAIETGLRQNMVKASRFDEKLEFGLGINGAFARIY